MEKSFIKYIHEFFKQLIELHGLTLNTEQQEGQSYMIEYSSDNFVIKIEKYFREFYIYIYKMTEPEKEINLFNLLEYLKQGDAQVPRSEYFRNEKDIEECYKKQLNHISQIINENYNLINDFFNGNDFELKMDEFENYWKDKHPELYNKK